MSISGCYKPNIFTNYSLKTNELGEMALKTAQFMLLFIGPNIRLDIPQWNGSHSRVNLFPKKINICSLFFW